MLIKEKFSEQELIEGLIDTYYGVLISKSYIISYSFLPVIPSLVQDSIEFNLDFLLLILYTLYKSSEDNWNNLIIISSKIQLFYDETLSIFILSKETKDTNGTIQ